MRKILPALLVLMMVTSCMITPKKHLERFEFTQAQMGLPFRIVLYSPNPCFATNAATAAFARIAELNSILSDYDEHSELSRLSKTSGLGQSVPIGKDLGTVLEKARYYSKRSDGAFDVTVGPLVQLW